MRQALMALVVLALATVPAAQAKGPTSASIAGPGLEEPLRLAAQGNRQFWRLVEGLGFFPQALGAPFQKPSLLLPGRPSGDLGPKYTVRYGVPMGEPAPRIIVQDVYPYADGGPVTYMPPGQAIFHRKTVGGWYRADAAARALLVRRGLPSAPPAGDGGGDGLPLGIAGVALLVGIVGAVGVAALFRPRPRTA